MYVIAVKSDGANFQANNGKNASSPESRSKIVNALYQKRLHFRKLKISGNFKVFIL